MMTRKIVVVGAGGHARSVCDAILDAGSYELVGVISPRPDDWDNYRGVKWLGTDDISKDIFSNGCTFAAMGLGFMGGRSRLRERIADAYRAVGFSFPAVIDPTAIVSVGAVVGDGAFIGKGAIVNANASVGDFAIVNSGALVEHDCAVGDYTHIAVRACLCGAAKVGADVLVGANSTLLQGIRVGDGAIIGAGTTVLRDVPDGVRALGLYKGVR